MNSCKKSKATATATATATSAICEKTEIIASTCSREREQQQRWPHNQCIGAKRALDADANQIRETQREAAGDVTAVASVSISANKTGGCGEVANKIGIIDCDQRVKRDHDQNADEKPEQKSTTTTTKLATHANENDQIQPSSDALTTNDGTQISATSGEQDGEYEDLNECAHRVEGAQTNECCDDNNRINHVNPLQQYYYHYVSQRDSLSQPMLPPWNSINLVVTQQAAPMYHYYSQCHLLPQHPHLPFAVHAIAPGQPAQATTYLAQPLISTIDQTTTTKTTMTATLEQGDHEGCEDKTKTTTTTIASPLEFKQQPSMHYVGPNLHYSTGLPNQSYLYNAVHHPDQAYVFVPPATRNDDHHHYRPQALPGIYYTTPSTAATPLSFGFYPSQVPLFTQHSAPYYADYYHSQSSILQAHQQQLEHYYSLFQLQAPTQTQQPATSINHFNPHATATVGPENSRLASHLISLLPIEAQPSKTRQAYGMGKVWEDEFEAILGQISEGIVWKLLEVESNPNVSDQSEHIIVAHRGHYVVRPSFCGWSRSRFGNHKQPPSNCCPASLDSNDSDRTADDDVGQKGDHEEDEGAGQRTDCGAETGVVVVAEENGDSKSSVETELCNDETSGCERRQVSSQSSVSGATDSGFSEAASLGGSASGQQTPVHSSRSSCASTGPQTGDSECGDNSDLRVVSCSDNETDDLGEKEEVVNNETNEEEGEDDDDDEEQLKQRDEEEKSEKISPSEGNAVKVGEGEVTAATPSSQQHKHIPTRFRMFIDSAKVRFCCEECGHGWTSMKGRVVFWYELFELENCSLDGTGANQMLGFCAYKLFGQQCDICKVEGRFERPMWYPEEVVKVLINLCNKIGQVYFGFRTPSIDKQRRAGKPKTSHNSSLCQACQDGLCTDRK